jgi:hypothetical protein
VLNALREHCFQDAFKNSRTVHTRGSGLLGGRWWPVGPKLVSDKMASQFPGIMDRSLYLRVMETREVCCSYVCVVSCRRFRTWWRRTFHGFINAQSLEDSHV